MVGPMVHSKWCAAVAHMWYARHDACGSTVVMEWFVEIRCFIFNKLLV